MKKSFLFLNLVVLSAAMLSLSNVYAGDTLLAFRGGGGGGGGGFRGSAEYQNDVNAGGRGGTYKSGPGSYERGYNRGEENANDYNYNNSGGGYSAPVYVEPNPANYGPTLNPDQQPY